MKVQLMYTWCMLGMGCGRPPIANLTSYRALIGDPWHRDAQRRKVLAAHHTITSTSAALWPDHDLSGVGN